MTAKYQTVTPAPRTGRCQCCGVTRNKLALYRSPTMLRACRDCAILDHATEPAALERAA